MKNNYKTHFFLLGLLLIQSVYVFAQYPKMTPEKLGYWFTKTTFQKDTIDLVIVSKIGEQHKKKPIILIEKGSLPIPLIIEDNEWVCFPLCLSTPEF